MDLELLTVSEAAETLRCRPQTLYQLVKHGEIRAYRLGRKILFDPKFIRDFLKQNEVRE